jgi:hypothetical protein
MSVTLLAQHVFYIVWLGWYDTRAANIGHVYALTDDGQEYRLPSNYFKPFSVVMSRHDYMTIAPRRWPTNTWGTTVDYSLMRRSADNCDIPLGKADSAMDEAALAMWQPKIERYHRYVLSGVDNRGLIDYDLYPHHIWSNPWQFEEFKALDKRRIAAYRIEVEVVCLPPSLTDPPRVVSKQSAIVPVAVVIR